MRLAAVGLSAPAGGSRRGNRVVGLAPHGQPRRLDLSGLVVRPHAAQSVAGQVTLAPFAALGCSRRCVAQPAAQRPENVIRNRTYRDQSPPSDWTEE